MADNTSVQVAVRVRPLVESETAKGCRDVLQIFKDLNQVRIKDTDKAFTYNFVYESGTTQNVFYTTCIKDLIQNLFKGYNVTILAYGQTGSGKTHSMGTSYTGDGEMGVIPRAVSDVFLFVKDNFSYDFTITVSFMELYQEVPYDLLSGKAREQCVVEIREDTSKGIIMPNLTEHPVNTAAEALSLLAKGSLGRATSSTNMNAQSSRSHAIYTVNICMQKKDNSNLNKTAKFHLVDLAGSERSKKTGATGQTFKEGVNINKGLLALGNVMSALGDEKSQHGYISYRDSNLTRLMKDSLGGNSITLMIACVSPADYNLDETLSTLRYADRARKIKNKPVVNQDPKAAEINRLNKLVQQLRLELAGQGGPIICQAELELLKKELGDVKVKNCQLNVKLATCLNDNAALVERSLTMQNTNEELIQKLKDLKDEYTNTLESLSSNIDSSDIVGLKENVMRLLSIKDRLGDINSEQIKKSDEIRREEARSVRSSCSDNGNSEHEINEKQETHTAHQVALNSELQDVMKQLALKEHLVQQITTNTCHIVDYNAITENETKIAALQSEKDDLMQQLKNWQSQGVTSKAAEQRRKRIQELEALIQDLRKKVIEQDRLIKIKEKDEEKVKRLNGEILTMKQTKVQLIKKMREEAERFRVWKIQKERDLHKLKDQDRKRLNQITKMEIMHSKQQNVLKRKFEEAAATNRRLKEALAKRKAAQESRNLGKGERVAELVKQELDVHVNLIDAENALKILLDDRATLCQQLEALKSDEEKRETVEVKQLENEIELRSAQIQELQQKILDSDEGSKAQTRWDNFHTMAETKQALRILFDLVTDIRKRNFTDENKAHELENANAEMVKESEKLLRKMKEEQLEHSNNQREYEEKISVLLRRLNDQMQAENIDNETKELFGMQQEVIAGYEKDTQDLKLEVEALKRKLEEIKQVANKSKPENSSAPVDVRSKQETLTVEQIGEEDEDDIVKDPDWKKTPLARRITRMKHVDVKATTQLSAADDDRPKRSSEGGCACKGKCATKNCGCRKVSKPCGGSCKCAEPSCANRDVSSQNSTTDNSTDSTFLRPSDPDDEKENVLPKKVRSKLVF